MTSKSHPKSKSQLKRLAAQKSPTIQDFTMEVRWTCGCGQYNESQWSFPGVGEVTGGDSGPCQCGEYCYCVRPYFLLPVECWQCHVQQNLEP